MINEKITPDIREVTANGESITLPVYSFDCIVIGSGAAGLNCADILKTKGKNVALVTEGMNMGTSRNTGSDKQTYYKLTLSDGTPDSVSDMARSFFDGGAMHGDLALNEAAGSTRAFMRLVELGVPFPYNEYGEFVGYQTDHDTRTRATSCGPLTSKFMTEALERSVRTHEIPILDGHRAVKLLTDKCRAVGVVTLSEDAARHNKYGISVIFADNTVWATGGPSSIYSQTVYPESQTCAHGAPIEAGAALVNVTESQYGIASVKFRWNLSGTYQQVLPRYFSTLPDGSDEREFLCDSFRSAKSELSAIFKKGYQWPFDPAKLQNEGSSGVDMAVFAEHQKGRRVFMDFRRNPSCADIDGGLDFSMLDDETRTYLENSGADQATPIKRLAHMNAPTIELYASHGINLYSEPLEIAVCAQHNNGGFSVNKSYESTTLPHLYIIGEAAGVFGIHRPGGSALNSTQVSSRGAAEHIAKRTDIGASPEIDGGMIADVTSNFAEVGITVSEILTLRRAYGDRMSACGAFIRNESRIRDAVTDIRAELADFGKYKAHDIRTLRELSINRNILLTQLVYLEAILEYINDGGLSRGSYLIIKDGGSTDTAAPAIDTAHRHKVCEVVYKNGDVGFTWCDVRPIPDRDNWFENVYNRFREENKHI